MPHLNRSVVNSPAAAAASALVTTWQLTYNDIHDSHYSFHWMMELSLNEITKITKKSYK